MDCWIAYYAPPYGAIPPGAVFALLVLAAAGTAILVRGRPRLAPARVWAPFAVVLGTAVGLATAYAAFERCPGNGAWVGATLASCALAIAVLLGIGAVYIPSIRAIARRYPRVSASALAGIGAGLIALVLVVIPALIELARYR